METSTESAQENAEEPTRACEILEPEPKRGKGAFVGAGLARLANGREASYEEVLAEICDLAFIPNARGRALTAKTKALEILADHKGIRIHRTAVAHFDLANDRTGRAALKAELRRVGIAVLDDEPQPVAVEALLGAPQDAASPPRA